MNGLRFHVPLYVRPCILGKMNGFGLHVTQGMIHLLERRAPLAAPGLSLVMPFQEVTPVLTTGP